MKEFLYVKIFLCVCVPLYFSRVAFVVLIFCILFSVPQSRSCPQAVPHFHSFNFTINTHCPSFYPIVFDAVSKLEHTMPFLGGFRTGSCFLKHVHSL